MSLFSAPGKRLRPLFRVTWSVLVVLGTLCVWTCHGEPGDLEFSIQGWDARQGLSATAITSLCRTSEGYLWAGTRSGVVRFDGVRFKLFDTKSTPLLGTNHITSLLADQRDNLWIGTQQGLLRVASGGFDLANAVKLQLVAPVASLVEDGDGKVWAAIPGTGVLRFESSGSGAVSNRLSVSANAKLLLDASNHVCLFSDGAVWVRQNEQWSKQVAAPPGFPVLESVCANKQGGLWAAAKRSVFEVSVSGVFPETLPIEQGEPPRAEVSALLEDKAGRIWAGTLGGGVFFRAPGGKWQRVNSLRRRPLGSVTCLYEDPEGLLWAGTQNRGLFRIKPRSLSLWPVPIAAHEGLPHTVCAAHDGSVWVGTDGAGVFRYEQGVARRFGRAHGLEDLTVMTILEDRQRNLWFGTAHGLYRYESQRFERVADAVIGQSQVSALFQSRSGELCVGMVGRIARMEKGQFRVYALPQRYRTLEVRAIVENQAGTIWVGTRGGGLFRLLGGTLRRMSGFTRPSAVALHFDQDDALWVGSLNGGLSRVKGKTTMHWAVEDGLPNGTVYAIMEDSQRTLWIASNEGVYGLSKDVLTNYPGSRVAPLVAQQLLLEEGLSDLACMGSGQPSAARSPDGRFWFPTTRGVLAFHPASMPRGRHPQAVFLEEVWVDGVAHSVAGLSELRVPSRMRRLEFRYTAPEMDAPGGLRFRHRLEGVDADWVDTGAQRAAYYGRLPPDKYEFHLMAGGQGQWQHAIHPLSVVIVPRLWERRDFQIGSLLALLAFVGLAVHLLERGRAKRRLARLEFQHAMERERSRIARDLHDDLGSGLTEIMLLGDLAGGQESAPADLRSQVALITDKTRRLAGAMDEVVWTVNPKNDNLPDLASYVADFAREFLAPTRIHCRIDMPAELPRVALSANQRHNLFLATKEALNNVVRHARASEVWVRVSWEEGRLRLSVEDNGHGFAPAAPAGGSGRGERPCEPASSGNGLGNMRARLVAIGGQAEIESQPGCGTRVRFLLPLPDAS